MARLTLLVPPGAENFPISFGTSEFPPFRLDHTDPASRWAVTVPDEAAVYFLHNAGFSLMTDAPQAPQAAPDMARLRHPDPAVTAHGCGYDGVAYRADEKGVVTVPTGAVAHLWNHGFRYVGEEPAPEPAPSDTAHISAAAEVPKAEDRSRNQFGGKR